MDIINFGTFFRIIKSTITDASMNDEEACNLILNALLDEKTKKWFTIRSDTVSKLKNNKINLPRMIQELYTSADESKITAYFEKHIVPLLEPLKLNEMKEAFLSAVENDPSIRPEVKQQVYCCAEEQQILSFLILLFRISMLQENKLKRSSCKPISVKKIEPEKSFEYSNRRFCFYLHAFQNPAIKKIEVVTQVGMQLISNEQQNTAMINFLERGGQFSILINCEEKRWEIGNHMKSENRHYLKTEECIAYWKKLKKRFPDSLKIMVTDIPILHNIIFTTAEAKKDSEIYVVFYTYTVYNMESNPQLLLHPENEYFHIYLSELRYLQDHAQEVTESSSL